MKQTTKSASGTSFHDDTIFATVSDLRKVLGEPRYQQNDGQDKVNFDWVMETSWSGEVFTVYDWKEGRRLREDEEIEWHIGAHTSAAAQIGCEELEEALNNL
jgi:hypothetical protein